jgi:hypothetical protein
VDPEAPGASDDEPGAAGEPGEVESVTRREVDRRAGKRCRAGTDGARRNERDEASHGQASKR